MLNVDEVRNELIDKIKSNIKPYHFNAGKSEIMIRCPYCGDSIKNSTHTHMYIGISDKYSIPYYCQRCAISDYVDSSFLKDIGLFDTNLMSKVDILKREYKKKKGKERNSSNDIKSKVSFKRNRELDELIIPKYRNSKLNNKKYEYINSRFSVDLSPEEYIEKYKVIFSFKDFLIQNEIEEVKLSDIMLEKLVKNYVGFLSSDKSYIIFRNIEKNCPKNERYFMFNIFDDKTGKRFYTASSQVDYMSEKVTLVLAEGPFDIIGIREYFYKDKDNVIFAAVNGKGYNLVVNYFARLGFLDMDIIIYSDKDVEIEKYKNFKKFNPVFYNNKIQVYYNKIEKDYGVKKSQIQLTRSII